jgi:hypothetical protein
MTETRTDGLIYVFANADNTASKIGFTQADTPADRADSYSREHGIRWRAYWSARTERVKEVETPRARDAGPLAARLCAWRRGDFRHPAAQSEKVL